MLRDVEPTVGKCDSSSVLLQPQEQHHSRSELASQPAHRVYPRCPSFSSMEMEMEMEIELRGKCRLEQVLFRRREMERTSSIPTLPTMALGRCRSKPKQLSAGGLDMHAVLCRGSTQCGTVWTRLVPGRGEPIPRSSTREALQPHTAMEHVGSSNSGHSTSLVTALLWVVLAPLPATARAGPLSVGSVGDISHVGASRLSRAEGGGDATFRCPGGAPAAWPDNGTGLTASAVVTRAGPKLQQLQQLQLPSSRKSLRGSRQRHGHQQEPIILGQASRPAGLVPGSPSQS